MTKMSTQEMLNKVASESGFLAALDQSGGSTPKALRLYGVEEDQYSNDEEMFGQVHAMRSRIVTSPSFNGNRILGAILFEHTLDNEIGGMPAAQYLWTKKNVVPFLKVDKGLSDEADGAQVMKPMPQLDELLEKANQHGVFGTKMRSVIKSANALGVAAVVEQQFDVAKQIIAAGLVPIIEPEVDINAVDKSDVEDLLKAEILKHLDVLSDDQKVMLKLTLPNTANLYAEFIAHPNVTKVVALSGGYNREVANAKVNDNAGMIASFSRALTEGLNAQQSESEFDSALDTAIESIYRASLS